MSEEFLVINTSPTKVVREQPIEVLPVFSNFDSSNKLLLEMIPEFDLNELHKQEMQTFIRRLKKTMVDYGGLGLSANQCGYRFRMFVMGSKDEQIVCINPRITNKFDDLIKLSVLFSFLLQSEKITQLIFNSSKGR